MDGKHYRSNDDDAWPCDDEHRPSKSIKLEQSQPKNLENPKSVSSLELPNEAVVGQIYPECLETGTARFLVLQRGSTSDEIRCDLIRKEDLAQTSPGETLTYEALSYAWGEVKNPDYIVFCGFRFAVTRNLAEALRYLRYPNSDRRLWVDVLCINQYDKKERAAQVRSMHLIYRLAKEVIAWLGLPDDASNLAYFAMTMPRDPHAIAVAPVITIQINNDGTVSEDDPFKELMKRPYWSRAWIVQEMMSARSLVIQCGSEVVPYSKLEESHPCGKSASFQISSVDKSPIHTDFRGDSEVKIPRLGSRTMCPQQFLDCFLDRQCGHRHDSIFAFLNLLSDDIQRKVGVCYDTNICELLRNTAQAIIESTHSLHIIVIRGRQEPPSALGRDEWQLRMPSWCPYLATPYVCCPIEPHSTPTLFEEKAVVSFVDSMLRVRGFVIGKVSQTISRKIPSEIQAKARWNKVDIKQERKHYLKCIRLGLNGIKKHKYMRQISIEASTRTLLAGRGEIDDVETLRKGRKGDVDEQANALRKIRNNRVSRLICSFRLSHAVAEALNSSKAAPAAWINRIALVPRTARRGDFICTILGCATPVVLRRIGKRYHVLGEAYSDTSAMGSFRVAIRLRDFTLE